MKVDKKELLENLITELKGDLNANIEAYNNAKQDAINAPGSMLSRSDTSKYQHSLVAEGLTRQIETNRRGISNLTIFKFPNNDYEKVRLGDIIKLDEVGNGDSNYYFIVPFGAGTSLDTDIGKVMVITPNSPLAYNVIDKHVDDEITLTRGYKDITYKISEKI